MRIFFISFVLLFSALATQASDSLRTEVVNGRNVVVHKVEQGQTLFSLARKYGSNVNEIKAYNPNMTQLQVGMEVFIPSRNNSAPLQPESIPQNTTQVLTSTLATPAASSSTASGVNDLTHKVQPGETLYRISKLYNVSPQEISALNNIGAGGIKVGQELRIPKKEGAISKSNDSAPSAATPPAADKSKPKVEKKISATGYPSITESGNATYEASIGNDPFFLVLHKTAPVGTLLFIKNKENGNTVHAKVSGPLKNGPETTIVAVNKLVYEKLEAKTSSFGVEVFYTPEQ